MPAHASARSGQLLTVGPVGFIGAQLDDARLDSDMAPEPRAPVGYGHRMARVLTTLCLGLLWLAVAAVPASAQEEDKALGQPATASSVEGKRNGGACGFVSGDCAPRNVNDGDLATRWSSEYRDGEYWQVDLGRERAIDRVSLTWQAAYAARFTISTSVDGVDFSTAADVTQVIPQAELDAKTARTTSFPARTGRYLRVTGVERSVRQPSGRRFGTSLWNASVFGPLDEGAPPPVPPPDPPGTLDLPDSGSGPGDAFDDSSSSFPDAPDAFESPEDRRLRVLSPFPVVRLKGSLTRRGAAIALLSVRAPRAARVRVSCQGRDCARRRAWTRRGSVRRVGWLKRKLRAGTVVRVFVTQPRRYGKYTRFKIRRGRPPERIDRCALASPRRAVACPGS